ncbi:unnamed protein product [Heligmosomoides polygyrus]|uniref:Uncharacterized protein n=1 Tax=Heligmosomoides polygyrus TaxID=6339 RepID=A0A183FNF8_HELPZ|nr:unnamed protein product [Heligmosomoides polygyrus]
MISVTASLIEPEPVFEDIKENAPSSSLRQHKRLADRDLEDASNQSGVCLTGCKQPEIERSGRVVVPAEKTSSRQKDHQSIKYLNGHNITKYGKEDGVQDDDDDDDDDDSESSAYNCRRGAEEDSSTTHSQKLISHENKQRFIIGFYRTLQSSEPNQRLWNAKLEKIY